MKNLPRLKNRVSLGLAVAALAIAFSTTGCDLDTESKDATAESASAAPASPPSSAATGGLLKPTSFVPMANKAAGSFTLINSTTEKLVLSTDASFANPNAKNYSISGNEINFDQSVLGVGTYPLYAVRLSVYEQAVKAGQLDSKLVARSPAFVATEKNNWAPFNPAMQKAKAIGKVYVTNNSNQVAKVQVGAAMLDQVIGYVSPKAKDVAIAAPAGAIVDLVMVGVDSKAVLHQEQVTATADFRPHVVFGSQAPAVNKPGAVDLKKLKPGKNRIELGWAELPSCSKVEMERQEVIAPTLICKDGGQNCSFLGICVPNAPSCKTEDRPTGGWYEVPRVFIADQKNYTYAEVNLPQIPATLDDLKSDVTSIIDRNIKNALSNHVNSSVNHFKENLKNCAIAASAGAVVSAISTAGSAALPTFMAVFEPCVDTSFSKFTEELTNVEAGIQNLIDNTKDDLQHYFKSMASGGVRVYNQSSCTNWRRL